MVVDDRQKFELNFLVEFDDEALLNELRRISSRLPDGVPLTSATFLSLAPRVSPTTLRRRFGDWRGALERAGLGERYFGKAVVSPKVKAQVGKGKSREEIVEELKRVLALVGTEWLTKSMFNTHSTMEAGVIRRRFGSFQQGLEAASIPSHPSANRRLSDEDCFQNLAVVWTSLARVPHYKEMFQSPSCIQGKTYVTRWRTWRGALIAFVEWTNEGSASDLSKGEELRVPLEGALTTSKVFTEADRREVRPGLRFRVFKRDHFKCVACGRSPAMHIGIELHADHVLAVANGGKTTFENLQTLCQDCNLGKGKS